MAKATYVFWGAKVKEKIDTMIGKRIKAAAIYFSGRLKKEVSRSQPTKGTGIAKRGLKPSAPGEFPKIVIGAFRRSIMWEYDKDTQVARVGSNSKVAFWLEFGTRKMKRRPWLTIGTFKYRRGIRDIVTGKGMPEEKELGSDIL